MAPLFRVAGVTFDFWETLFMDAPERDRRRDEFRCEGLRESFSKLGVNVSMEDLADGFRESNAWLVDIWRNGKQASTLEQIRYIMDRATKSTVALPTDPVLLEQIEESYCAPSLRVPPTLNGEALGVLQGLRERRFKVGLVCNTGRGPGRVLRELMRREGLLEYFDSTVFSDEVGFGKPDRRIYLIAAERMGLEPSQVLHVGDNLENDVLAAQLAGMKALLFEYEVPVGFREQPSLLALTRASDSNSKIRPDGRIKSLIELLTYID